MIIRYLGMLACLFGVAPFVRFRGVAMRSRGFVVVFRSFVVVVFWHYREPANILLAYPRGW
jgi:hypothetical protein